MSIDIKFTNKYKSSLENQYIYIIHICLAYYYDDDGRTDRTEIQGIYCEGCNKRVFIYYNMGQKKNNDTVSISTNYI